MLELIVNFHKKQPMFFNKKVTLYYINGDVSVLKRHTHYDKIILLKDLISTLCDKRSFLESGGF